MNKKQQQLNCCMECTPTLLNLHEQNLDLQQKYQQMKLELIQANINNQDIGKSTQMFTTVKKQQSRCNKPQMIRKSVGINQNESRSINSTKDSIYQQTLQMNKQFIPEMCSYQKSLQIENHKNHQKMNQSERNLNPNHQNSRYYNNQDGFKSKRNEYNNRTNQIFYNNNSFNQQNKFSSYSTNDNQKIQQSIAFMNISSKEIHEEINKELNKTSSLEFETLKQGNNELNYDSKDNIEQLTSQKQQPFKYTSWKTFFGLKNVQKNNINNDISPRINNNFHKFSPILQNQYKKQNINNSSFFDQKQQYLDENMPQTYKQKQSSSKKLFQHEDQIQKSLLSASNKLSSIINTNISHDFSSSSIMLRSPMEINSHSKFKFNQKSNTPQIKDLELTTVRRYENNTSTQNLQDLSYRKPLSTHNRTKREEQQGRSPNTPQSYKLQNKSNILTNNQFFSQSPLTSTDLKNDNKLSITNRSGIITTRPFPIHSTPILNNLISSNKKIYYFDNSVEGQYKKYSQRNEIESINPNFDVSPFMSNIEKLSTNKNINIKQIINDENKKPQSNQNHMRSLSRGESSHNGYAFSQSSQKRDIENNLGREEFKECKQILFDKYNINDFNQINNDSNLLKNTQSYFQQSQINNDQTGFFNDDIMNNVDQSCMRSEVISTNKLSEQQTLSFVSNSKSVQSNISSNSQTSKTIWYKMVSVVGDRYFSIFDGQTEFIIGKQITKPFQQQNDGKVKGGITLHKNLESAFNTKFPQNSCLIQYPKAIIKFITNGQRIKIKDDHYVHHTIIPIEAINLASD